MGAEKSIFMPMPGFACAGGQLLLSDTVFIPGQLIFTMMNMNALHFPSLDIILQRTQIVCSWLVIYAWNDASLITSTEIVFLWSLVSGYSNDLVSLVLSSGISITKWFLHFSDKLLFEVHMTIWTPSNHTNHYVGEYIIENVEESGLKTFVRSDRDGGKDRQRLITYFFIFSFRDSPVMFFFGFGCNRFEECD